MRQTSAWLISAAIGLLAVLQSSATGRFAASAQEVDAKTSDDAMKAQIVSKEREGLDALKAGDVAHFGDLTADDAVFVDSSGIADKAQVLKNVEGFRLTDFQIQDVKFQRVAAETGLISYRASENGVSHGREFAAEVYVSSIWTHRGGKWTCLFSQETPARRPAPAK
jgi:hypothetical protein